MDPICSVKKRLEREGEEVVVCDDSRSRLLEELHRVQDREGYVSDANMQEIAGRLGLRPVEVYSVVTFYSFFSLEKKGEHVIRISTCQTCWMKGSEELVRAFEDLLGVDCGGTTPDGRFTLERSGCIGMCDRAPAIMLDDELLGPVAPGEVKGILERVNSQGKGARA